MFQTIDYNQQIFLDYLGKHFPNQTVLNTFLECINYNYISISGSSILQIIQQHLYTNTDLDIYIEISNLNKTKINNIQKLIRFLYNFVDYSDLDLLYDLNKVNSLNSRVNIIPSNHNYPSLKQYIKLYQLYENKTNNFKIELIYIKCDIEYLLTNSFDYDIVKNYWKQNNIYSLNMFAIITKTATMTLNHFIKRIMLGSTKEFTNFIDRYNKYYNRGFKIFIHKTNLTKVMVNHMTSIYFTSLYPQYIWIDGELEIYNNNSIRFNVNYYLNNISYTQTGQCRELVYNHNNNFNILSFFISDYIIKYILIAGIIQKKFIYTKLNNYSLFLLEKYLHPDSAFILYKHLIWNTQISNNKICYINKNNKLSTFLLITDK
jgi:hypothetical protein